MDEEAIENIRETSRNVLVLNRRKHRDEESDVRRSMSDIRIDTTSVTQISNKLKTKLAVSVFELRMLKNALIDDAANIETVLHTHGALRGLVREIIGHDVNKQCAAVGCCCNLALGDSRASLAVAKAAGAYLVPTLDNLSTELAVCCAWTLGNLAGSGPKACELLTAQGAVTKLTDLLTRGEEETRDAGLYALVHFTYQLLDDLKMEYLTRILVILPTLDVAASAQLLFILSCHNNFLHTFISEDYLLRILNYFNVSIEKTLESQNIVYMFRILANLNSEHVYVVVLNYFISYNMVGSIKKMIEIDKAHDSVMWFLGNAYKYCSNHVLFERLLA